MSQLVPRATGKSPAADTEFATLERKNAVVTPTCRCAHERDDSGYVASSTEASSLDLPRQAMRRLALGRHVLHMSTTLTIVNFCFDLEIGPPESHARLITYDLAEQRARQGFRPPKLIELSIADRFVRAQRAMGRDAVILEQESATAEGTGDFVYRVSPLAIEHRVEVVRHVDSHVLAARAARRRALDTLRHGHAECLQCFSGYMLRLDDDLGDELLRSALGDVARSLIDFSHVARDVPANFMRMRRWRHPSGGNISASVVRAQGVGAQDWQRLSTAVRLEDYESRIARTIEKKLLMFYDKPSSAFFELLVWTTNDTIIDTTDAAAVRAVGLLSSADYQPFDRVWFITPLGPAAEHLVALWPHPDAD